MFKGFLVKLFAGGVRETLDGVGSLATKLRSAITGELPPEQRAKLEVMAIELEARAAEAQQQVNAVEAAHMSVFVAGWRPAVGWICALAFGYHFIAHPLLIWCVAVFLPEMTPPPPLSLGELMPVLLGMLGLGGMRSYEKKNGVNDRH